MQSAGGFAHQSAACQQALIGGKSLSAFNVRRLFLKLILYGLPPFPEVNDNIAVFVLFQLLLVFAGIIKSDGRIAGAAMAISLIAGANAAQFKVNQPLAMKHAQPANRSHKLKLIVIPPAHCLAA